MNKYLFKLICVAGMLVSASCSNSEIEDVVEKEHNVKTFMVTVPTSSTRAYVESGGVTNSRSSCDIYWAESDKISVFGNGSDKSNHEFTFDSQADGPSLGKFVGNDFSTDNKYYLMYPYQSSATISNDGIINAVIPHFQKATSESFDPKSAIWANYAMNTQTAITLLPACAFFKIETEEGKRVKYIQVSSNDNSWYMSGNVKLSMGSNGTKIDVLTASNPRYNDVYLTADGNEYSSTSSTFNPGVYLISFVSSDRFPGVHVKVLYEDDSVAEISNGSSSNTYNFASGTIYNLGYAKANN